MKVLFQSRTDLFTNKGGDTYQIEYTKKYIEKLFPDVKIDISTKINEPNINDYDIVNVFNLDWIVETYPQVMWAKKHNKKVVLNAIHHSYKEVKRFEKEARYDFRRITNFLIPNQEYLDMLKNVARSTVFMKFDKFKPTITQLKMGIRNQQREILRNVDMVIVQTEAEYHSIKEDFNVDDFNYKKVVLGVNTKLFGFVSEKEFVEYMKEHYDVDMKNHQLVLNVGRVEPRKNQINLIKAFREFKDGDSTNNSDFILVFIGAKTNKSPEFVYKFNKLVQKYDDIYYLGSQTQKFVASAMASRINVNQTGRDITTSTMNNGFSQNVEKNITENKKIYVQTSWFETIGLVSLEAALSGMSVVASGNRIKDYLKEYAVYCNVGEIESISDGIKKAVNKDVDEQEKAKYIQEFRQKYTWENTAKQTIEVYRKLLQNG